jgi:hypothetical protein
VPPHGNVHTQFAVVIVVSTSSEVGFIQRVGGIRIMPSARLTYFHSRLDGYDEQSPLLALSFVDRDIDALLGGVRLRGISSVSLFGPKPSSVFGEIGYEDYLSVSNDEVTASLGR